MKLPPLESTRAMSLLAYLLLHRDVPQRRERIAFLLWPDSSESQARTNLRHVLHHLRHAIPDPDRFLDIAPRTLQWRPDAPAQVDVLEFGVTLAHIDGGALDAGEEHLYKAVKLYAGDLLEGLYDEWLEPERERLRRQFLGVLEQLATLKEEQGQHTEAIGLTEQLLRRDPLNEAAYRRLMRLHDTRGNRASALQVYHLCAATLERELGVEPSAATREAYESLLPTPEIGESLPSSIRPGGQPLIGRINERRRLTAIRRNIERDGPHFVLIHGDAGIGKTRLAEDFISWNAHRGTVTASARAFAAEGAIAYGPLVAWLRSTAFDSALRRLGRPYSSTLARLLPELPGADSGDSEKVTEPERRQILFEAAAQTILSVQGPVLLFADDLQWFDRETLQFLHFLIRFDTNAPLLVLATARSGDIDRHHPAHELRSSLLSLNRSTEIELTPLSREETELLAKQVTRETLSDDSVSHLYRDTEGNPLFVIEALRAGWEHERPQETWTSPRVQTVIEARIFQLSVPAQDLIGVAATIGREFTAEVLAHASGIDDETLVLALDELWRRRLIREQGTGAYDFSHDKVREVAYLSLSPALRRHHHRRLARTLEHLHAANLDQVSGEIARHVERAGDTEAAIEWHRRAATASQHLFAHAEAVRLLEHALDLLHTLPESPQRHRQELDLLAALPAPLAASDAYASTRLSDIQARAMKVVTDLGVELPGPLLRSLAVSSLSGGEFDVARDVGLYLKSRAEREHDDVVLVESLYLLGIASFWRGQFIDAREHFQAAIDRYRREDHATHLLGYGQDPRVICQSRLGNTLWFLGDVTAAIRASGTAVSFASELGHPYSQTMAIMFSAMLALDMRDTAKLRAHVDALDGMATNREAMQVSMARTALRSHLDVLDHQDQSAIMRTRSSIERLQGIEPAPGSLALTTRIVLETCVVTGAAREGLELADRVLRAGSAGAWEAEVRRLRAVFLASTSAPPGGVEAELIRALHTARRQSARMLELRVLHSLVLHYRDRDNHASAEQNRDDLAFLVENLRAFGDCQDLVDATALLTSF